MDLSKQTIVITGSNGFLGQHLCQSLEDSGVTDLGEFTRAHDPWAARRPGFWRIRSSEFDLVNAVHVETLLRNIVPDIVIHLAAAVGGIGINQLRPGTFYYKNLIMGALLMEYSRRLRVQKFVALGTVCAYPKCVKSPFVEDDLWDGYPEITNAPYGIAKKAMLVQAQAYRQEFGFNAIYLLPVNLYGPGDNFNLETSHVIPALIRKFVNARDLDEPFVTCWGTGQATREFLYVKDAARAINLATSLYNDSDPVNIGSGVEISIATLATIIAEKVGYSGEIRWDVTRPDGQPRRCLDVTRAEQRFGFKAQTNFEDGLMATIDWYERNCK